MGMSRNKIVRAGLAGILGVGAVNMQGCEMSDLEILGLGLGALAAGSPHGSLQSKQAATIVGQGMYQSGRDTRQQQSAIEAAREGRSEVNVYGNSQAPQQPAPQRIIEEKKRPQWSGRPEKYYKGFNLNGIEGVLNFYNEGVQFRAINNPNKWESIPYQTIMDVDIKEGSFKPGLWNPKITHPSISLDCWDGRTFTFECNNTGDLNVDYAIIRTIAGDIERKIDGEIVRND